jgi:hypothetical protein
MAELGRYIIKREEYGGGLHLKHRIYLGRTGELIDEFVGRKENQIWYREDTCNKEGLVYAIEDYFGRVYTALIWIGEDGTKKVTGRGRTDKFSAYDWQEFVTVIPSDNEKQDIFWLKSYEDGEHFIYKTVGCIITDEDNKESASNKSEIAFKFEADIDTEFAWRTTYTGIYLVARSIIDSKEIVVIYKIAEHDGARWESLEQVKVVTKAHEIKLVLDFEGFIMEGFKKVEFGG